MKFHDTLNDKLFNIDTMEMLPEVKEKLEEIAEAFIEFLEIPTDAVLDKVITGSSASYNYNEFSDLDLHIIVDYDKVHEDCPLVNGYLNSLKKQFNDNHDIFIHGVPVELYAEQKDQGTVHNGLYSLQTGWIDKPQKIAPTDNDAAVEAKYNEIKELVDKCDDSEEATELLEKIYNMRKAGLAEAGEFCTENLAFKKLRNEGCMDKLRQIKKEQIDKQLSLESYNENFQKLSRDDFKIIKTENGYFKVDGGYDSRIGYIEPSKNIWKVDRALGNAIYKYNTKFIQEDRKVLISKLHKLFKQAGIPKMKDMTSSIRGYRPITQNGYYIDIYRGDRTCFHIGTTGSKEEEWANKIKEILNNEGVKYTGSVDYFTIDMEKQDNKNESIKEDIMDIDAELLKNLTNALTQTYQTINGNKYKVTAKQDKDMIEITMTRISKVFPMKRTFFVKLNDNKVELFFNDKKLASINKTMNVNAIAGNFRRYMKEFDWGPDYELEISSKDKLIMSKLNIKPLNQDVAGNYIILYHTDKGYGINIASNGKVQWWNLNNKEYPSLKEASNIAKKYYPNRQQYYIGKVQSHFYAESLNESIKEEIGYYVIDKNGGMEGEFSTKSEANGWKRQYNKHNKLDIKNDYVIVTNTQLKELKDRGITEPEDIFTEVKKQNENIKGKKEMREEKNLYVDFINQPFVQEHLWNSAKARLADEPEAKIGSTNIDIDRMISLFTDKLSPEEYKEFNVDTAENYLLDEMNKIESDLGFKPDLDEDLATLEKKMDNAEKDLQDMISKLKGTTNEELITNLDTVIKKALDEEVEIDSHKFTFKVTDTNIQLKSDWYETIIDIDGELDQTQLKSDIEDTLDFESTDFFEGEGEITGTEIVGFKYNEDTKEGEFEFNIFFE